MHWNPGTLKLLAEERRQEWMREAARDRLVRQIRQAARPKSGGVMTVGWLRRIWEVLLPRRLRPAPQPVQRR